MNVFKRIREHRISHYAGRTGAILVALVGAALVVLVTVDLGPWLKPLAERRGSQYLDRELAIGSLKINLFKGRIVVHDLRIGGLHRGDRPFFTAKSLSLTLDWLPAFALRPNFTVSSVEMTDWQMLVEKWENQHSFPRFTRNNPSSGPRPFTTTMKLLRADRGQFVYEDHELPWSVICRESRDQHRQPAQLSRYGDVHRRYGRHSGLPADVGEHEGAVHARWSADQTVASRSRKRWRGQRRQRRG